MIALLDGDIIAHRCAASAEYEEEGIAHYRCSDLIRRILHEISAEHYELYLGGQDNFRYGIYPEYKANRREQPRPTWLESCREYLVKEWKAELVNGYEVDDKLGIQQTKYDLDSIICSIDKDLLQIPGNHYSWEIAGHVKGKQWVRPALRQTVSPYDGLRTFYKQLILGDLTDNIPGYDGKLRAKCPQFIQKLQQPINTMNDEWDMFCYVEDVYETPMIELNAKLLWIMKEEDKPWQLPVKSVEGKQQELNLNQD